MPKTSGSSDRLLGIGVQRFVARTGQKRSSHVLRQEILTRTDQRLSIATNLEEKVYRAAAA